MKLRQAGTSGLRVSALGLGTKTWGQDTDVRKAGGILDAFVDAGGTLIDTATSYADGASLQVLSRLLTARGWTAGVGRSNLVISAAAGVFPSRSLGNRVDCSRRSLLAELDRTLDTLGTDHVDIWNVEFWDPTTPPEEVASALHQAVRSGKARYVGVRGYRGWQLALTQSAYAQLSGSTHDLCIAQSEYNLIRRTPELELLPAAGHLGVGLIAGAGLAQGILTGKYHAGGFNDGGHPAREAEVRGLYDERSATIVEALRTAARGLDIDPAVAALAWLLSRDGVTAALVGARTVQQLSTVLPALSVALPQAIIAALDDIAA